MSMESEQVRLIGLTADIVSAYVSKNAVPAAFLPELIESLTMIAGSRPFFASSDVRRRARYTSLRYESRQVLERRFRLERLRSILLQ